MAFGFCVILNAKATLTISGNELCRRTQCSTDPSPCHIPPLRLFRGRPTAEVTLPAPLPIWCIVRVHFALTVLLPERAADK